MNAPRSDIEALVTVMAPAMGDDCTLDELRAYAARIINAGWTPLDVVVPPEQGGS